MLTGDQPFITTPCPGCGPSEIEIEHVVVRVHEETGRAHASIRCPDCGSRFTRRLDDGMCLLLTTFGATVVEWARPAEVDERPLHLPPISARELIEFGVLLDAHAELVPLVAAASAENPELFGRDL